MAELGLSGMMRSRWRETLRAGGSRAAGSSWSSFGHAEKNSLYGEYLEVASFVLWSHASGQGHSLVAWPGMLCKGSSSCCTWPDMESLVKQEGDVAGSRREKVWPCVRQW